MKKFLIHSGHRSFDRYCHIVKNKCWLCLFSDHGKQNFCFIGNAFSVFSNSHHQRHIQNPAKHLRWSFLQKWVTAFSCQLFPRKSSITDVWSFLNFPLIMIQRLFLTRLPFKSFSYWVHKVSFFNKDLHLCKYPFRLIHSKNVGNAK